MYNLYKLKHGLTNGGFKMVQRLQRSSAKLKPTIGTSHNCCLRLLICRHWHTIPGWWFEPLWKKSIGMMKFPIYGNIKFMATKPPTSIQCFDHQNCLLWQNWGVLHWVSRAGESTPWGHHLVVLCCFTRKGYFTNRSQQIWTYIWIHGQTSDLPILVPYSGNP